MTLSESRPRLAVIVAEGFAEGSRAHKTALSAAADGWDVTLFTRVTDTGASGGGGGGGGTGDAPTRSALGPVSLVRVPVGDAMRVRAEAAQQRRRLRRRLTQPGLRTAASLARRRAAHAAWVRENSARVGWTYAAQDAEDPARGLAGGKMLRVAAAAVRCLHTSRVRVRDGAHRMRMRAYHWEERHAPGRARPSGHWREDCPELLDLDLAFGPAVEETEPDLIHAAGAPVLATAALSAARLRARGRRCAWVYDAHDYARGAAWTDAHRWSAGRSAEREFIRRAHGVVAPSPEIAETLHTDHGLGKEPLVVRDMPRVGVSTAGSDGSDGSHVSVREVCGLRAGVPLLVHAGDVGPGHGLDTVVGALPGLPEHHLALVHDGSGEAEDAGDAGNAGWEELLALAGSLGVRDRVHTVPRTGEDCAHPHDPRFLASADLGLVCARRTSQRELTLPDECAAYLRAGLPLVVGEVRTAREHVAAHGAGVVFDPEETGSLAEAVREATASLGVLMRRITGPVREELSWGHQAAGLLDLYREITGHEPVPTPVPEPETAHPEPAPEPETAATDTGLSPTASTPAAPRGWAKLSSTPVRLGLGPANYAGQLASFARAVCDARPDVSAEVFTATSSGSFGYPSDVLLDNRHLNRLDVQLDQVRRVLGGYTHLLADAFRPVLGTLNGNHIAGDLPALRRAGIKVALLAHGSEVRHPLRHMDQHPHSLFHDAPEGLTEALVKKAERNRDVAEQSGLPLFATTPDLLDDLPPWAVWAPLVIDVDAWACDRPVLRRRRPVVLHAPSKRWTKGTERVLPVLQDLHERGAIDFRLAEGVPWPRMRGMVREADIVVDQFAVGSYGTFGCEGMAAGKPVVAFLSEAVAKAVGSEVPVVNTTADGLRPALESLLDDREEAARLGTAAADFARAHHDGRRTAQVLNRFLSS
ncbi:glycosyltransferase [Streptomyces sp. NPDC054796]